MKIPIIDLHEDVSFYFLTHPGFKDFRKDDLTRPADIPSYKDANV